MSYNFIEKMLWLFLLYSFIGWLIEVVVGAVKQKRFVNKGLIDGPFCISYGFAVVLMSMSNRELSGIWLFLFTTIWATSVEWVAGHIIEHFYHERWWDYSDKRFNVDGYICLSMSLVWGVLGYAAVTWINGLFISLYDLIPVLATRIIMIIIYIVIIIDVIASLVLFRGTSEKLAGWEDANNWIAGVSLHLANWISGRFENRIKKAYPKASKVERTETVFAKGCSFYKIVLLFIIGSLLGDIIETIYCKITSGIWMSRSSVVWGPFSLVWGIGIAVITLFLYRYKDKSVLFLFMVGTCIGGAYEYICSVFTEVVFGKVFWDYSHIPFNLAGRVNLLYCLFWGVVVVIWFKWGYPLFSNMIEKIPIKPGKVLTWAFAVFMCFNIAMSSIALVRYEEREDGAVAENHVEAWVDTHFDDNRMSIIYPNARTVK